jgi:hypothetical protein
VLSAMSARVRARLRVARIRNVRVSAPVSAAV